MTQTLVQIVIILLTVSCILFFACAIIGLLFGELINITKYIGGRIWKRN